MNDEYHKSVLLQEVVDSLAIQKDKKYLDGTLGGGGHTREILAHGGLVLGIDQDDDALSYVQAHFSKEIEEKRLILAKGNFARMQEIAAANNFLEISGILLDLGVSSYQLDTPERGFSFSKDAALDMRMDTSLQVTASDLVNGLTKGELIDLFTRYSEEPFAARIATAICEARNTKRISTTKELADIVASVYPYRPDTHPATKVFQALRIAVNDELNAIKEALPQALSLLVSGGRLAIISFHSLEDRIVKNSFKEFVAQGLGETLTDKPIEPSHQEQELNRRSRSSKLRVFIKK